MNIHQIVPKTDIGHGIAQVESTVSPNDGIGVTPEPRSQALWVLIAVSIVVGVNGVLSWL